MTQEHQITPPPELVKQWVSLACEYEGDETWQDLASQAARWGADKELEACCKAFEDIWDQEDVVTLNDVLRGLRAARRPKPPSLKEQALEQLKSLEVAFLASHGGNAKTESIRRALESLPS